MTGGDTMFHQKGDGRWEWLETGNNYFRGPVDGSICSFETLEEASKDREQHMAAPIDTHGRRVRDKASILKLLHIAAQSEMSSSGLKLNVVWHRRDSHGNNWYVQSGQSIAAIGDVVTLLQATYSIPDED